ncbi:predicted protein [Plenodomus lingam JN3]|uniref:Predicted protein n=1 Tax=Leptosphaeria maculans (strain JN3 / isolate v23.1.3 / race Av1-4-5-6-7-8) TaxID=985895 RepID=E4ZRZ8_LEPMJ|nr:predicted protein [Plenodomus lingam JN3]CBX94178.1 predicted protein [Plenodomus lingam JN3]
MHHSKGYKMNPLSPSHLTHLKILTTINIKHTSPSSSLTHTGHPSSRRYKKIFQSHPDTNPLDYP